MFITELSVDDTDNDRPESGGLGGDDVRRPTDIFCNSVLGALLPGDPPSEFSEP